MPIYIDAARLPREITMKDEWRVGRVIARPYVGKKRGEFHRTSNRRDYALKPTGRTVLNALKDADLDVIGIGKINEYFLRRRDYEGVSFGQFCAWNGADTGSL